MSQKLTLLFCILSILFSETAWKGGLKENLPAVWALKNGKIFIEPGKKIDQGTIIIRDGIIENVGENIKIPIDATEIDLLGKTVYAGFIDSWLEQTIDDEYISHQAYWNDKVRASRKISDHFDPSSKQISSLQKLGFTTAHLVPDSGIFQGYTALVQLNKEGTVIDENIGQNLAYEVDGWSSDNYPNSLLGVIALIRQTLIDAFWYLDAKSIINRYPKSNLLIEENKDLASLGFSIKNELPFIFQTNHELQALRSISIGNEFDINRWLKGSGYEYRRIKEISKGINFIILPINFPITPDLTDPYHGLSFNNAELKHWDMAPDNPVVLLKNNISFALTSNGLKVKEFRKNLNRVIDRGLSEKNALASLTTIPAEKMGKSNLIGQIKKGYLANLTIVEGNYFNSESIVHSIWISGQEYPVKPSYLVDVDGEWTLSINQENYKLFLDKKKKAYTGKIIKDSTEYNLSKIKLDGRYIRWQVSLDSTLAPYQFTGHVLNDRMEGKDHNTNQIWNALKVKSLDGKLEPDKTEDLSGMDVFYPEGAYGLYNEIQDDISSIIVTNTTLWTSSDKGVLNNVDILFENGKVSKVGSNLKYPKNSYIINGSGKHTTPGLIDCHSHTALFAINEGTQSITSEVRISDVINSDDIAIYRELAGGLTVANLLHGSANAIGGQNAVIKLRWGLSPEKLLFEHSMPGIKFALGENVKQSNWGDEYTSRYPQTRMGVEQILRDAFSSAIEYKNKHEDYKKNSIAWKKKIPPRRDLELEALVEILEGKRQIHCHSYRQDEILMLIRVAEDFGFSAGTFQHVLEGYKVADILRDHGANASTFSDWWAYKFEVIDAIPYNGAIMANLGVNVSFNSDSNELARRMNTEAAKGVKYGNLSEEEALKLVTINPAKQLNIDEWVGSLEIGKDADFVIWSDNPLSTKAKCEQTWIDGKMYFSIEMDQKLKNRDVAIRNQLINKILSNSKNITKGQWKHHEKSSESHHNCSKEL